MTVGVTLPKPGDAEHTAIMGTMPWWSALAVSPALPPAGQEEVAQALAVHGSRGQRTAFYGRDDLTKAARICLFQAVSAREAALLLAHDDSPDVECLKAAVAVHGPCADFVILCARHPHLHAAAVQIAAQLRADQAIEAARRWPRREQLPMAVHTALIEAMLADLPSRELSEGPDEAENRRAFEAQHAAEITWEANLWELLEHVPQLWESLARRETTAGRHVQWVLLARADDLPDETLRACLPAVTHSWWGKGSPYLTAHIRLCALRGYVESFPRLREIAQDRIDQTVAEVLANGWSVYPQFSFLFDWDSVDALAVISRNPRHLTRAANALVETEPPNLNFDEREPWETRVARAAIGLASNPITPDTAVRGLVHLLDRPTIRLAAGRGQEALRSTCAAEIAWRDEGSSSPQVARKPIRMRSVPSDRRLSECPEPYAALRECLSLIDGPPAQREPAIAAMLASEFMDSELLSMLPAADVLTSEHQAESAAELIAAALGEDHERWAAWGRLTEAMPDSRITLGRLLSGCAR
ncbi:MAG TPA: hypothetical protein VFU74_00345 [Actinocrinis sp.]|nr:hypothetical protein [Actinocrinis sp.]